MTLFALILRPTTRFAAHAIIAATATHIDQHGSIDAETYRAIVDRYRDQYPA